VFCHGELRVCGTDAPARRGGVRRCQKAVWLFLQAMGTLADVLKRAQLKVEKGKIE
jgi:hypothetical protein